MRAQNTSETRRRNTVPKFWIILIVALSLAGCGAESTGPVELQSTPRVDTASFESGVQEQLAKAYAAIDERPQDPDAYGELGRTLHAYELRDAAEIAYRNARTLDPREIDWTYLLAVVLQEKGDVEGAREAFRRTLELDADDLPARIRLGQTLSDANRLREARRQLSRAVEQDPATCLLYTSPSPRD